MNKLEENLNTRDNSYIRYFFEVDLQYPKMIKVNTGKIPFCPKNKVIPKDKNTMNKRIR